MTARVPHPDAPGLADLVGEPGSFVSQQLFREAVWSPAGSAGREPERFASVEQLWDDLRTRHARTPFFRLVRDGVTLPPSSYCRKAGVGHRSIDDVAQPNRVAELFHSGATVVLQGLQLSDPHLGRLANNLALALDHPVQINAYLTPAAAKGLELHFDFHDVFVVQLDGHKRWRVWSPLPRTVDPVRAGVKEQMPTFDELGEPLMDFTLGAGDVLYLPRGFPHCAEAVDAPSSHLTIGVMAVTWQQAVRHALDDALGDVALRRSLPANALDVTDDIAPPALDAVVEGLDSTHVRSYLAAEIWRRQPATRLRPLNPPVVDRTRSVAITPGPLVWLTDGTDKSAVLGLGDRSLTLPGEAADLLAGLLAAPAAFDVAAWGGVLDETSRWVVIERLAAEGVVRTVAG